MIHLEPHSFLSPDAMEGNISDIILQYTRGDTPCTTLQPATIHLKPHFLFSPDTMEGNIKYIRSQYTRGDTPCTTCSQLRFMAQNDLKNCHSNDFLHHLVLPVKEGQPTAREVTWAN